MNISAKQQSAKDWSKALSKLNESQAGQVQIVYEDDEGKKKTGYISLLDVKMVVNDTEITLGALLTEMLNMNLATMKVAQTAKKAVDSVGTDLLIVKTDDLGFVEKISTFNTKNHIVIANQPLPKNYNIGYYYVKDGVITLSEERKLELFPDYV